MQLINKFLAGFIFLLFIAQSCKKEDDSNSLPSLGLSYFPLETGKENYYKVDSIGWLGYTFDPITQTVDIDTVQYEIKEVVQNFFTDASGRETANIVRYKRSDPSEQWVIYKVYSANVSSVKAERYEDNVRYTKLVFPVKENTTWTGQYLDVPLNDTSYTDWEYKYLSVDEPEIVGGLSYDSVCTVNQINEEFGIYTKTFNEKYAAGTGLIFKEYLFKEFVNFGGGAVKNGFYYRETRFIP